MTRLKNKDTKKKLEQKTKPSNYALELEASHPHDRMFKQALHHKKAAISLIEEHAPDDIKKRIDTSTVKVEKNSFIEKDFKESACDVLLSVKIAGKAGYVYILAEQQTKPDYHMAFRLMKYMLNICSMHLKKYPKSKYLPLVCPVVIFNGKNKYIVPRNFWDLFEEKDIAKKLWTEDHKLVNVNEIADETLAEMGWIGALEYFLKHWHRRDLLPVIEKAQKINMLKELIKSKDGVEYFEIFLHYLLTGVEKNDNIDVKEIIKSSIKKNYMGVVAQRFDTSIARYWLDEGIEKGIEKGKLVGIDQRNHEIAANMLKRGADIQFISSVTGLPLREIQKLKNKP